MKQAIQLQFDFGQDAVAAPAPVNTDPAGYAGPIDRLAASSLAVRLEHLIDCSLRMLARALFAMAFVFALMFTAAIIGG